MPINYAKLNAEQLSELYYKAYDSGNLKLSGVIMNTAIKKGYKFDDSDIVCFRE